MRPLSQGAPVLEPSLRRILVVDDEPRILDFVSRGLRREDFSVDVAADGKAGLERALGDHPTIIVLDNIESVLPGNFPSPLAGEGEGEGVLGHNDVRATMIYTSVYHVPES